jgi:hypothetical protein
MKQNIFSVKSPPTISKTSLINQILDIIILSLVPKVLDTLFNVVVKHPWMVVVQHVFYLYQISKVIKAVSSPRKWQNVCTVRVLPFGIQIEERTIYAASSSATSAPTNNSIHRIQSYYRRGKIKGFCSENDPEKITFIPAECILDVVVLEIVLSYKVMSVVAFRIDKEGMVDKSFRERLHESSLAIAFHPDKVHMTYMECMQMWKGIKEAMRLST